MGRLQTQTRMNRLRVSWGEPSFKSDLFYKYCKSNSDGLISEPCFIEAMLVSAFSPFDSYIHIYKACIFIKESCIVYTLMHKIAIFWSTLKEGVIKSTWKTWIDTYTMVLF